MPNFKKSLGQNFLIDKNIINKISSLENIEDQIIFEIGPGSGNLTSALIKKKPKKIFLIEKDRRFYEILNKKYKTNNNYKIFNEDILGYNLAKHKCKNAIVFGNLPYNISTQILAKFINIEWPPFYKKIIFMFQKEVANRITAKSGSKEFSRITILSNYRLEILDKFDVSKNSFFPSPKVDSTVVIFKPKNKINYKISNIKNLEKITQILFSNKRKMINKSFAKIFNNYKEVADKFEINLKLRPSELSCRDYYKITEYYERIQD